MFKGLASYDIYITTVVKEPLTFIVWFCLILKYVLEAWFYSYPLSLFFLRLGLFKKP